MKSGIQRKFNSKNWGYSRNPPCACGGCDEKKKRELERVRVFNTD